MTKNKKGKKKNKMAGRTRPSSEQSQNSECTVVPVVLSDTSELEDPGHAKKGHENTVLDPEAFTSDSGFDSGRGSPGDEPGTTATVVYSEPEGEKQAEEDMATQIPIEEPKTEPKAVGAEVRPEAGSQARTPDVELDSNVRTKPVVSADINAGNEVDLKTEDGVEAKNENEVKIKSESEVEIEMEDTADDSKTKETAVKVETRGKLDSKTEDRGNKDKAAENGKRVGGRGDEENVKRDTKTGSSGDSPPLLPQKKGASSLRQRKPLDGVKHPLEFPWEFWVVRSNCEWNEALLRGASFDTAEDFWLYFNAVRDPLATPQPILMFKKNIRPEWEDVRNAFGNRWNLSHGLHGRLAADVWQELALMLIGGIEFGDLTQHLNGIYSTRKGDGVHFSVWLGNVPDEVAIDIGEIIHGSLRSILKRSFQMELVPIKSENNKKRRCIYSIK